MQEKLTDVVLAEADPDKWPGQGIEPGAMDQQTRGDRYWCKKNAVATISLLGRVQSLVGSVHASGLGTTPTPPADPEGDAPAGNPDLDAEVAAAEKEAKRLLSEIQNGTAKAAFDQRVHGRATS